MSAYVTSVLAIMGINVMLAVSLNMISGFCGQFSLGHAAFYGAGAYGAAFFAAAGTPLPVALLAGVIVAGLLGLVVGFAALRLRADFLAVTTISRIPASGLGSEGNTLLIIACALVTVAASLYVDRSWMGFAFRAVGDDEETARTVAIPVSSYKLVAFTLGTAIAGLAGGLYAYFTQFIVPDSFGFILSVALMAMVVIGGTGSTLGVVAAAILLTLLPEMFRFINEYRLLIFGGLLVLVMRFAPGGLAGLARALILRLRTS
jgi:branched-chain amino acid transport system permease protein